MKQYLDHDSESGISHWVDTDEETGITTYGADQEVAPILDMNQAEYNGDHGRWGEFTKVASIPMVFFADLVMSGVVAPDGSTLDDGELRKRLKTVLNDIDYRKLRTRPGSI
jgi:hypothetical protein